MLSTRQVSTLLIGYGLFLVVSGLIGYEITIEHSTSALFNGSIFGSLIVLLGVLHRMGRMWTLPASISAAAIFSLTFLWRSGLQWMKIASETTERTGIAVLLTVMATVSVVVFFVLRRSYRH
ncbi:MAG: hypothetical protein FGM33_00440 [Candidatus Kapabacteria bacterium]|nr:hypothetical protein [Candidatus Kapabacteria bacterium]